MPVMAKKKDAVNKTTPRAGKPIHVWVDESLYDAIETFRASQRLEPTLKDTVELALQEFLKGEGFWPVKDDS